MARNPEAPVVKLPVEVKARLEIAERDVAAAKKGIEALKKMGMDVRALEEKLEWAEGVRKILLAEFS